MEEEKKDKSYVIRDKRIFAETGDVRKEEDPTPEATPMETKTETRQEESEASQAESPRSEVFPEVNFANFILSLGTTAMYHFGDFPDPASQKAQKNLVAAKETIDVLGMLRTKTEGNLDIDEKSLLDGLLFELRMRYVKEKDRP